MKNNKPSIDSILSSLGIADVTKLGRGNRRIEVSRLSDSQALNVAYGGAYAAGNGYELHRIDEPAWYDDGTMCVTVRLSQIA